MTITIRQYKTFFLVGFLFLALQQQLSPSILHQTLVTSIEGLTQVDNLKVGSTLIGFNFNAQSLEDIFRETSISAIKQSVTDIILEIKTESGVILSPPNQYFYDPVQMKWVVAQDLTTQNFLFSDCLHALSIIDIKQKNAPGSCVCDITVAEHHTFFISDGCNSILVHNEPITVILGTAASITLPQVVIGVAFFSGAAYLLPKLFAFLKSQKNGGKGNSHNVPSTNKGPNNNKGPENNNNQRIINVITKAEFFKRCSDRYEHWIDGIYKLKDKALGFLDGKAYFLQWDHLHNDVEVYNKGKMHLGSLDPLTLILYKGPVVGRKPF